MNATIEQIKYIHKLLPEVIKSNKKQKQMVVVRYTNDNAKTSTKDLNFDQANRLIKNYGGKPLKYDNWAYFDAENKQHSYIRSLCIQLGWSVYKSDFKKHFADLHRLSEWLKSKKSPVQKPLKKMQKTECSKIITALESILTKSL